MTPIDITGLGYFMPIFGFLIVFLIIYAVLAKTKILGGVLWIDLLVSLIIASIFSVFSSAQEYIETATPWFAVLLVALFFILLVVGLGLGKVEKITTPAFVSVVVAVLILIFVISAIKVFPSFFGSAWASINKFATTQTRIFGGIVLVIIAALAAYLISRK